MLPKRLKNYNYNHNYKYKICNKIFENGFVPPPLLNMNNVKKTSGLERNGFPKKTEYNTVEFLKS